MSANGLPTPDSTPGPDPDRIAADKSRQESEKTEPSASAPKARQEPAKNALVTKLSETAKGKNGEQVSVQSKPPYDEEVEEDAPMPDAGQKSIPVTKPSASARAEEPALPTVPENGKQSSVEPPSDEAVVQAAAMPDASSNHIARQQRHREAISRVLNARGRYYDFLDLKPSCSENDVKAAFRRTSMLIHPDKSDDEDANNAMKSKSQD